MSFATLNKARRELEHTVSTVEAHVYNARHAVLKGERDDANALLIAALDAISDAKGEKRRQHEPLS